EPREREEGDQDVVTPLHGHPRDDRAHDRRPQREEVHPGVHHREHGWPEARRVRADALLQGPHDQGREGGAARRGRGRGRSGRRRRRGRGWWRWRSGGRWRFRRRRAWEGRCVMIEGHATSRYIRTSAQKAKLVLDQIRG